MAKVRVFYRIDGGVTIRNINEKAKFAGETDTDFFDRVQAGKPLRPKLVGATFEDIEKTDLPVYDSATRPKWRKKAGGGVFIDNNVVTTAEKKQKIEDDLDAELAKTAPNPIAILRLQRKLDKREYD